VHGLSSEFQGRINFVYLDVDDPRNNDTFTYLHTSYYIPELFIIDGEGSVLWMNIGSMTANELRQILDSFAGN
jgi:hypothetical protein